MSLQTWRYFNRRGVSPGKHPFIHGAKIFIILVKTQHHLITEQTPWINLHIISYIASYSQTHSRTIITPTPTEYPRVIVPQSTRGVMICQEKLWWTFPIWNGIIRQSIGILRRHFLQIFILSCKQDSCHIYDTIKQNNAWLKWWTQCLKANKKRKYSTAYFNLC